MPWGKRKQNPEIEAAKQKRDELEEQADAATAAARKVTANVERMNAALIAEYEEAEKRRTL